MDGNPLRIRPVTRRVDHSPNSFKPVVPRSSADLVQAGLFTAVGGGDLEAERFQFDAGELVPSQSLMVRFDRGQRDGLVFRRDADQSAAPADLDRKL